MSDDSPDVFAFMDSRAFLAAHFKAVKARRPSYSYRAFARAAQAASPNYLQLVIEGKRNLSEPMATRFAKACGLQGDAATYFEALARFTQAKEAGERDRAYAQMCSLRGYQDVHPLEEAVSEYHRAWYIPAIRELAARADFRDDAQWIARLMVPAITEKQARHAMDVLYRLGLFAKGEDGVVHRTKEQVTTGAQTTSVHMRRFHQQMMARALYALDEMAATQRDISSVTVCMDDKGLATLREATAAFRRTVLSLEKTAEQPRQVFQVNIQLFPLSATDSEPNPE